MKDHRLLNPGFLELDDTYRSVPAGSEIILAVDAPKLDRTLTDLEKIGFVAIEISISPGVQGILEVRASKGKHGPCYDTGRKALYLGAALAVLDDDSHLLIAGRESPVCEKTAKVYQLRPYHNLIRCSDARPELKAMLQDQPLLFDCNTFEGDQEAVFARLPLRPEAGERLSLFYPGPFRLLILRDGTIVRRGRVTGIPAPEVKKLIEKDRLIKWGGPPAEILYFQDRYAAAGPCCLLDDDGDLALPERVVATDLSQLSKISDSLRGRLSRLIDHQRKYFILTGSDPGDVFGCCPSEEVGQANRLVRAGILSSWAQEVPADGCPVTIYAFKGELKAVGGELQFQPDETFRGKVKAALEKSPGQVVRSVARWVLLLFVAVSLLFAFFKIKEPAPSVSLQAWFEQLNPGRENQVLLLLFHYGQRCRQCRNMENYTRNVLEAHFREAIDQDLLRFQLINMDEGANIETCRQLGLFSATLLLVRFAGGATTETRVLKEAWTLYDEEEAFKTMIKEELDQFLQDHDE